MGEIIPYLFGLTCGLGLIGLTIVLPIVAFVRSRRVEELAGRLDDLEDEVRRLRRLVRRRAAEAPAAEAEPEAEAVTPAEPAEALPAEPPAPRRRGPLFRPPDAISLEDWLGRRGLGWAAVVLLLFATAF